MLCSPSQGRILCRFCACRAGESHFSKTDAKLCLKHSLTYLCLFFIVNTSLGSRLSQTGQGEPSLPVSGAAGLRDYVVEAEEGRIVEEMAMWDGGLGNLAHRSHVTKVFVSFEELCNRVPWGSDCHSEDHTF